MKTQYALMSVTALLMIFSVGINNEVLADSHSEYERTIELYDIFTNEFKKNLLDLKIQDIIENELYLKDIEDKTKQKLQDKIMDALFHEDDTDLDMEIKQFIQQNDIIEGDLIAGTNTNWLKELQDEEEVQQLLDNLILFDNKIESLELDGHLKDLHIESLNYEISILNKELEILQSDLLLESSDVIPDVVIDQFIQSNPSLVESFDLDLYAEIPKITMNDNMKIFGPEDFIPKVEIVPPIHGEGNVIILTDDIKDFLEEPFMMLDPFFDITDPDYINEDGTIKFPTERVYDDMDFIQNGKSTTDIGVEFNVEDNVEFLDDGTTIIVKGKDTSKLYDLLDIANTYSELNVGEDDNGDITISMPDIDDFDKPMFKIIEPSTDNDILLNMSIEELLDLEVTDSHGVDVSVGLDTFRLPDMVITATTPKDDGYQSAYDTFFEETNNEYMRQHWDQFNADGFFDFEAPGPAPISVSTCDGTSPFENTVGTKWGGNMVYFEYEHTFLEIIPSKCQTMFIPSSVSIYKPLTKMIDEEIELWRSHNLPVDTVKFSHMLHAYWGSHYNGLENSRLLNDIYYLNEEVQTGNVQSLNTRLQTIEHTLSTKMQTHSEETFDNVSKFWVPPFPDYYSGHAERAYKGAVDTANSNPCKIIGLHDEEFDRFINRQNVDLYIFMAQQYSEYYWKDMGECPSPKEYIQTLELAKAVQWYHELIDNVEKHNPETIILEIENCDIEFLAKTANWKTLERCTYGKPNVWNDQARAEQGKSILLSGENTESKYARAYELQVQGKNIHSLALYNDIQKEEGGMANKVIAMNKGNNFSEMGNHRYAAMNYYLVGLDSAVAVNGLGTENWRIGNVETAVYMWTLAITLDSELADAYNGLGMYYRTIEDWDGAERMYNYVLDNLNPEHPDALGGMSLIPRD